MPTVGGGFGSRGPGSGGVGVSRGRSTCTGFPGKHLLVISKCREGLNVEVLTDEAMGLVGHHVDRSHSHRCVGSEQEG